MPVPSGNALQAAVAAVARRGRSQRGEKTMLDALGPAADAWQEAAAAGDSLRHCADAAQHAADTGRAATGPLVATKGRASYLGERSRGHIDPGATSATMIIGALADAIAQVGEADGVSR
jgi:dihydroxyacetone kinase-like protein